MNVRKMLFWFLALLLFTQASCQRSGQPGGVLTLSEGWRPVVYLVQPRQFSEIALGYSGLVVDSAVVGPGGRFTFTRIQLPAEPGLYQLCIQREESQYPNKLEDDNPLLANYMPVVLQQGHAFHCTAEAARLQESFAIDSPSPENEALLRLRDIRNRAYARDSAFLEDHPDELNLLDHEAAVQRFREPLMAFAGSSPVFWASIVAARWVSHDGNYERVPEFLFQLCEKWRPQRPGDPWAQQVCAAGNRERLPVLVGDPIPDYPLPMESGDTLRLHQLFGSRLTVVDIWAAWCLPCRRENRETLSPLWARYKDKGLQIVGYSIDSNAASWKAAIAKDGAAWRHASHLSGDATPFMEALRISTIPANFILDAKGKVIAKNLHGQALEAFVGEYFK